MKTVQKFLGKDHLITIAVFIVTLGMTGILLSGCTYSVQEKEESSVIATVAEGTGSETLSEYDLAVERAEYYYNTLMLSRANASYRLINNDGFSEETANYALRKIGADWRQNALKRAKILRDEYSISNTEIFYILTDSKGENFTRDEADYAIKNLT